MNNNTQFILLQKGKKTPQADKNTKKKIFVSNMENYSDVAISLLGTQNIVVIDFDSLKENNGIEERIIKGIKERYGCNLIVKTDKGFHLYFKSSKNITKTWTKRNVLCGARTDAKVSGDNYLIIKRNGVVREHIGQIDLNNLTELPDVLLPFYDKLNYDVCNLEEGSRNDTLFKHLCRIRKSYDEEKDKIDLFEIATFINNYVFATPLPENEVVSTVNSARKQEIETNQVLSDNQDDNETIRTLVLELIEEYDIYYHNEQLFFKQDDMYICDNNKLTEIIYSKRPIGMWDVEPIKFHIKMNANRIKKDNVIGLKNGAIIDRKFVKDYKEFTPYQLDVEYKENAYCKEMDDFLNTICCNKEDVRIVLEEMIGHCLMLDTFPHKFFYLFGEGSNGKSTLMNCLFSFFGNMAVSVPLNMLSKENYVIRCNNVLVNLSDDIDMTYISSSQNLKSLCSGSYITGRNLYEKPFTFKSNCTQIFVSNSLFSSKDKTYGFNRRIELLPLEAKIRENNKDPLMLEKITTPEAKSYLLLLALRGIERIVKNGYELSESRYIKSLVHRYIMESDSVEAFLEFGMASIEDRRYSYVYDSYTKYCIDNNFTPCKKNGFSRRLTAKGYNTFSKKIETEKGITKSVRYIRKINPDE